MNGAAPSAADLDARISLLVDRYRLSPTTTIKLRLLFGQLSGDPLAPTSIRDPMQVIDRHLADSLVGLELESMRRAQLVLDLGSGAGVPGLPLAAARPQTEFVLLESSRRKCAFVRHAADLAGIENVRVVHQRAELFAEGRGCFDLVTARAVASLAVTAEYAAPLLRVGGTLVVWGGRRSAQSEAGAEQAGARLGLGSLEVRRIDPFPGALHRHLYLMSKVEETPAEFPRRPGMALKRPLGSEAGAERSAGAAGRSSDRRRR